MPCRFDLVWSVSRRFSVCFAFALTSLIIGCGAPANTGTIDPGIPVAAGKSDSEFAVPDGDPAKILAFIKELRSHRPKVRNEQEKIAYIVKVQNAMIEAGDKVLAQKADDKILREAMTVKLIGTMGLAANYDQSSSEFDELAKNALNVVDVYREDKRPIVATVANEFWMPVRALNLKSYSDDERKQLADEAIQSMVDSKSSQQSIGDAAFLAEQSVKNGDNESAISLYDRMAKVFTESDDQKVRNYAAQFNSKAERLRLIGSPLRLEGALLSGGNLDWESYRGKVVLVDFWATWCGPCIAELPNVKAAYEKYKAKGFDVIGVSLDHTKAALESFVKRQSLPWQQIFDNEIQVVKGLPSPMAVRFGVGGIPTAFLVDKEGNVVSLEAHGQELDRLLEKLLGKVE